MWRGSECRSCARPIEDSGNRGTVAPEKLPARRAYPERGLVAKLEGIVGSEFVHVDYGEAIRILERSNEKFEFPVNWGVDLQSEHERYLTEKYAKKPVIVMNYPKDIKAFYMRVNDDGRTVAAMEVLAPGDRRDYRRQPARGAARGIGPPHGRARHRPRALCSTPPSPASGRERGRVRVGAIRRRSPHPPTFGLGSPLPRCGRGALC
jgi:hypothetical protein